MTKQQMIEHTRRALEESARLPAEEQARRMIEAGIINEKGEVLWGADSAAAKARYAKERAERERNGK
jgi:hypothetical protein